MKDSYKDLHFELLKIAATAISPEVGSEVTYYLQGQPVEVLDDSGPTWRVVYQGKDPDTDDFSVSPEKLKKERSVQRREKILNGIENTEKSSSYADFVHYLQMSGNYSLILRFRHPGDEEKRVAKYQEWTGEALPEECIRPQKGTRVSGWVLKFTDNRPEAERQYPFTVYRMGTNEGKKQPQDNPVGLSQGNKITVMYDAIIEKLVKAGLRAKILGSVEEIYTD